MFGFWIKWFDFARVSKLETNVLFLNRTFLKQQTKCSMKQNKENSQPWLSRWFDDGHAEHTNEENNRDANYGGNDAWCDFSM